MGLAFWRASTAARAKPPRQSSAIFHLNSRAKYENWQAN